MTDTAYRLDDFLYAPVSPAEPCGPDMQRDESFFAIRSFATAKPGRYDPVNNVDLPPTPPEWNKVLPAARDFLKKSRDCTVLVSLVKAELAEGGLPALAAALDCLRWHLETFWDDLHPRADEDGDYWERMTALRGLADVTTLARPVTEAILHRSPMAGPVTLRTLAIAAGTESARNGELALSEAALEELIATENVGPKLREAHDAADAAAAILTAICDHVSAQEGAEPLIAKDPLDALKRVRGMLAPFLPPEETAAEAPDDAVPDAPPAGEEVVERRRVMPGDIRSDAEAREVMAQIMAHYAASGRSSPVPLVLARLSELQEMSFSEVLEQIAPGPWEEAALPLAGLKADKLLPKPAAPAAAAPQMPDRAAVEAASARAEEALAGIEKTLADGFVVAPEQAAGLRAAVEALKTAAAAPAPAPAAAEGPKPGPIETPADVRSAIDRLVKHYESADPNSVVPAFLRRAKPLVDRHFPEIIKELAPEGAGGAKLLLQPRKV